MGCRGAFDSRDTADFVRGVVDAERNRLATAVTGDGGGDGSDVDGGGDGGDGGDGVEGGGTGMGGVVDVVLSALAGEGVAASLGLLAPFGSFVELGKRGGFEGGTISMAPFLKVSRVLL
jgi:hypothetical protein